MARRSFVVLGTVVGACIAVAGAAAAQSPSARGPEPICADPPAPSGIAGARHPNDGIPDPAGRIVFGRYTRDHDISGQLVSLHLVDPDGSDLRPILDCETQRPRFSPDGTQLAFGIAMDDGTIRTAIMSVDGTDLRVLPSAGSSETPDWSRDGTWLATSMAPPCAGNVDEPCESPQDDHWTLWRVGVDGSGAERIGESDTDDWEPRLSPDGTQVVFTRFDPAADWFMRLVIRDLRTGEERVRMEPRQLEHPDWSPDGRWIVYNPFGCPTCEQIERLPADDIDAEPEVLYSNTGGREAFKPVYSPDGSQIAFGCHDGLCVMDADGSDSHVVLEEPGLNHFDWGVVP